MRIYADICTLCRPFDDQAQPRIWLESQALGVILNLVELGQLEMIHSPIHDLENAENRSDFRRQWIDQCLALARIQVPLSPTIKLRALELEACGIKSMDALHAASAEAAHCDQLLTCDDQFRKRYPGTMKILNPADFVVEYFQQTS